MNENYLIAPTRHFQSAMGIQLGMEERVKRICLQFNLNTKTGYPSLGYELVVIGFPIPIAVGYTSILFTSERRRIGNDCSLIDFSDTRNNPRQGSIWSALRPEQWQLYLYHWLLMIPKGVFGNENGSPFLLPVPATYRLGWWCDVAIDRHFVWFISTLTRTSLYTWHLWFVLFKNIYRYLPFASIIYLGRFC